MRVVHISKVKGIAGSEGHLLHLLPGLAAHGVETRMVVLEDPRYPTAGFVRALEARGVGVDTVPIRGHLDPGVIGQLSRHLLRLRPDLVHTHLLHADLYGSWAAGRARVPALVSSRHNNDAFRRNPVIRWMNRRAMGRARIVVAVSRSLARFVTEVEGLDPRRVVTVHYGLEPPAPDPDARRAARATLGRAESDPLVGVVGRSVRQKGIDVLLDAFALLRARRPDASLVVVGDGPLRTDLHAQSRRLGLDGAVTFTGWVDEASRLMPACDVIAVPSRWEGFGLTALEAMAHARPVVASRVDALPEIVVDGETGILVPPEDRRALAEAIDALLDDPKRAADLGRMGYTRLVTSFPVEKMVRATLDVYAAATRTPSAR